MDRFVGPVLTVGAKGALGVYAAVVHVVDWALWHAEKRVP